MRYLTKASFESVFVDQFSIVDNTRNFYIFSNLKFIHSRSCSQDLVL